MFYAPRGGLSRVFDELLYRCPLLKTIYPEGMEAFQVIVACLGVTSRLDKEGIDLFHGLSNELPLTIRKARHTRSVVTIHDLIFLRYPGIISGLIGKSMLISSARLVNMLIWS